MKEITRRLYTKPVMLGLAFLVGMALVVGLFVTTKSKASPSTFVQAGDDKFETTGNGETFHNFAASKIPAGFFNFDGKVTSNEYTGVVPLVGDPLPGEENIDTIIHRNQDVFTPGTTTLKMMAMNLKGINSITITYSDRAPEAWNVRVNLSDVKASTGSMTINDSGTFDSTLSVFPKFTFTRVSDNATKVLDTGGGGLRATQAAVIVGGGGDGGPNPLPTATIAPAPCAVVASTDFQSQAKAATMTSAAASTCAPVTLTSTNSPWKICADGRFCIPQPITEAERWANHNASPPGTKKAAGTKGGAVAE